MKKLLVLFLLSALLLTACSFFSDSYTSYDLEIGMKKADVLLKFEAGSVINAERYVFFKDTDDSSVILYFDENEILSRIETCDPPANPPNASLRSKLPIGTDVYEVIRQFGIPTSFSYGSYYQLTFYYSTYSVITTWDAIDTDCMTLAKKPYFADLTTPGTEE